MTAEACGSYVRDACVPTSGSITLGPMSLGVDRGGWGTDPCAGRYTVRAVDRALELLIAFAGGESDYTLSELAKLVGLGKPTVHRLVRTLEARGFVERRINGRYTLGPTLATLGMVAVESRELSQLVLPILREVVRLTGETASCTVLEGSEMVTVAGVAGMHRLRYAVYPGERAPASLTADGKVMLAQLTHEDILKRIGAEVRPSGRQVSKAWLRRLSADLRSIRESGVGFEREEQLEPGIASAAVPMRNHRGDVVAALTLTIPTTRAGDARLSRAAAVLQSAARPPIPWSPDAEANGYRFEP